MNDKPYITDSYMLKFLEQKLGIPQLYYSSPLEIKDELPYLQYIYQHLKEVWYGLMIADLMLPSSPKIDAFIRKFGDKALDAYCRSVEFSRKNPSPPMGINKIGDFYLDA